MCECHSGPLPAGEKNPFGQTNDAHEQVALSVTIFFKFSKMQVSALFKVFGVNFLIVCRRRWVVQLSAVVFAGEFTQTEFLKAAYFRNLDFLCLKTN